MDTSAPREPRRVAPALVVLLVVLGLLGVVAVAAGGDTDLGGAGTRRPSHLLLDTLVSLYLVWMVFGAVVFIWLFALRKDSPYERERLRREGRIRSLAIVALILLGLGIALRFADARNGDQKPQGQRGGAAAQGSALPEKKGYEPNFATIPVIVVLGLTGAAIGAFALAARARRRQLEPFAHVDLAEALEDALAESVDDLRSERDPRKAVVAAYARLERTLAAYGLPRRPSEAPDEYLHRILAQLEVSHTSIARLTSLFERAKFSQHEVDAGMKEEAIEALETTRDELREARERELAERAAALAAARERAGAAT